MARITKTDVHAALRRAADHLIDAAGPVRRVSRTDVERKLGTLVGAERALVDMLFQFVRHRDDPTDASFSIGDIEEAILHTRERMLVPEALDHADIVRLPTLGKLAVAFVAEQARQDPPLATVSFDPFHVEAELIELTRGLTLISEADAVFKPIVVPLAPCARLELDSVRRLFTDVHEELGLDIFGEGRSIAFDLDDAHAEERSFGEWFVQRRLPDDLLDPLAVELAVRTGELVDYLAATACDPRVFAYAERVDPSTGDLLGEVSIFILGRTPAGWLVGVYTGSVET